MSPQRHLCFPSFQLFVQVHPLSSGLLCKGKVDIGFDVNVFVLARSKLSRRFPFDWSKSITCLAGGLLRFRTCLAGSVVRTPAVHFFCVLLVIVTMRESIRRRQHLGSRRGSTCDSSKAMGGVWRVVCHAAPRASLGRKKVLWRRNRYCLKYQGSLEDGMGGCV